MVCQACQHDNPPDYAYCGGCGAALAVVCVHCGEVAAAADAFCGRCGQRLGPSDADGTTSPDPESGERRQLTVLFCDLVGSTALAARLDPEEYREALRAYYASASEVITRYGGYVAQHLGDGLLVYFGWPQAFDDAAERAVRAGLDVVEATATLEAGGARLAARAGLHTGPVVVSDTGRGRHEMLAVGDALNVAARVQSAGAPGEVLITAATHRLVSGLFLVEERGAQPLKGLPRPFELYRVVQPTSARGRLEAAAARGFTPFVNRSEERALLRSRFERVCDGDGQIVLLSGEAGIGKSRLAQVLRAEVADTPHTWLETSCSAHCANTPFYAVIELFKQRSPWDDDSPSGRLETLRESLALAGLDPAEGVPLVAPLLDIAVPDTYGPVVAAAEVARRRLLATLAAWLFGTARLQPLVILIEDLHWVDPSTLELLQLLVDQGATAPVLLIATARPEFQVPWPTRAHYTQLTLSRLPRRHVRDMVLGVAAQATLLAEVIDEVAARTDGVPLFVEELTKVVVEAGARTATREIPATLVDSLLARLDRLGSAAKEVAQVGAVCGREFSYALLHALHPIADAELETALGKLVNAELLHARGIAPDATYTFKHALVQDTAYGTLLRSRRRVLHGQVAAVLTRASDDAAGDHPERLAYHYTAAMQHERAAAAWQLAGERATERGAYREAEHHLERGLELLAELPAGSQRDWQEFQLQLHLGQARLFSRGFAAPAAAEALMRAMQLGEQLAEPPQLVLLLLGLFSSELSRNGARSARPLADQLLRVGQRAGVAALEAAGHLAVGLTHFHLGERAAAREHLVAGVALYGEGRDVPFPVDLGIMLHIYLADTLWHLGLADQARHAMRDAWERAARSQRPADRSIAAQICAVISLFLRDPVAVEDFTQRAAAACAEEPDQVTSTVSRLLAAWSAAARGDVDAGHAAAHAVARELWSTAPRLGFEFYQCVLADTCIWAGDLDGALAALAQGEDACPNHVTERAHTLGLRAEILALKEAPAIEVEAAFAGALACAGRYSPATGLRTATSYARWLAARGRADEARRVLEPLYGRFTEGFDTRDLREAGELLAALRGGEQSAAPAPPAAETHAGSGQ